MKSCEIFDISNTSPSKKKHEQEFVNSSYPAHSHENRISTLINQLP